MFTSMKLLAMLADIDLAVIQRLINAGELPQPSTECVGRKTVDGWEPETLRAWFDRRAARRQAVTINATLSPTRGGTGGREAIAPRLRFAVLLRDGFACCYCGRRPPEITLEIDHIVPVAAGGATTHDNLQAACRDCNSGKAARLIPGVQD